MKYHVITNVFFSIFVILLLAKCQNKRETPINFTRPAYDSIGFGFTTDTIQFKLAPDATTAISNSNYFVQNGKGYISFYDKVTKVVSFYNFPTAELLTVLPLRKWFTTLNLDKSTVYVKNFDSILVCTRDKVTLFDSSSLVKKSIEIPKLPIRVPKVDNETPPLFRADTLFVNIVPSVKETSISAHRNWRLLLGLNLKTDEQNVYYHLPEMYAEETYGYPFLQYSYCLNDKGRLVFSFPADTNVYETDLKEYNVGFFAKSQFQKAPIQPISKKIIEDNKSFQEYSLRDSYGPIFFDPYHKRYFRMAKQKMDQAAIRARERVRIRSILMLDENFKVIGEDFFPPTCDFTTTFFDKEGNMYARYSIDGDYQIRYVRVSYNPNPERVQIAHKVNN